MKEIETGIDKLADLLKKRGKVTLKTAAKELGVSKQVMTEWAEMLDQENLATVDYGIMDTTISLKKITTKDIANKKNEFMNQKDAVIRKIDTALTNLDSESAGLKKLQKEFDTIKKEISVDLDNVKGKMKKLEDYHKMKSDMDKNMISQKKDFENYISDINKKIEDEKSKYSDIIRKINAKESEIEREKLETTEILEKEKEIHKKLDSIIVSVKEYNSIIEKDAKKIETNKKDLSGLKEMAEKIKSEIISKRSNIEKAVTKTKSHEEKISRLESDISSEIKSKTTQIKSSDSKKKLDALFDKKKQIQDKILELEKEHSELEHELKLLRKKAISFSIVSKKSPSLDNIEKEFVNLSKKKEMYQKNIEGLFKLIQ
jgi:chromosome segregation ATPase